MRRKKSNTPAAPIVVLAVLAGIALILLILWLVLSAKVGRMEREQAALPSAPPAVTATAKPTATPAPTSPATAAPGDAATATPTETPAEPPTAEPSAEPTAEPTPVPTPPPTAEPTPRPAGGSLVPEGISRALFEDCGKNADGSVSASWYPGKVSRDLSTGQVTYHWDRYPSTLATLDKYGAIYRKNADQKVVYLTFDCGYEMGYTSKILDTLKAKDVQAVFFCAGDFFDDIRAGDLVNRMVNEGHVVGNHTVHHPKMVYQSDEDFVAELDGIQERVSDLLGNDYTLAYYRPPEGATNERDLYLAKQNGYTTVLWSFAYYDYNPREQWEPATALRTAESWLHDGCVYLLHAVSETNAEILGDLIDYIRAAGYEIRRIDQ